MPFLISTLVDVVEFAKLLKHTRGDFAGKPFILEQWQQDYLRKLLYTFNEDGTRQYRRSLLAVSRKNGKTQLAALLALLFAFSDEQGGECIIAAGDRSQAGLLFDAAKQLLESNENLSSRAKIYRNSIVIPETNSKILAISSESGTKHGYNPSLVIVDEWHVFKDAELANVLLTGQGARRQPMSIFITTAGTDKNSPCYKDWERAVKVRDGLIEDNTFLPCIYAADPEDDIFSEETWKRANPNYGITLKPSYFEQMSARAKESPSDETVFRTLHLNQWCSSTSKWLRHGVFEQNMKPLRPAGERPCYIGVDLASTFDTTAVVALWPDEDGTYDVEAKFFIPEENAEKRAREDRVPYLQWAKEGYVILTGGDITDYDVVRDYILSLCEQNAVKGVAIDRWNAVHLTTQLSAEMVPVRPFGQGFASMSAPTKLLETILYQSRIRAGTNPLLALQMSNVEVKVDEAGNCKPSKKHSGSTNRIDGAVALIMALGLASAETDGPDIEPEIILL